MVLQASGYAELTAISEAQQTYKNSLIVTTFRHIKNLVSLPNEIN